MKGLGGDIVPGKRICLVKMQPPERAWCVREAAEEVQSVERGMRRRLGWSRLRAQVDQRPDGSRPVLLHAWGGTGGPGTGRLLRFLLLRGKPRVVGLCIRKTVLRP